MVIKVQHMRDPCGLIVGMVLFGILTVMVDTHAFTSNYNLFLLIVELYAMILIVLQFNHSPMKGICIVLEHSRIGPT